MSDISVPQVQVGVMSAESIEFVLNNDYMVNGAICSGLQSVQVVDGKIRWNGQDYDTLLFEPRQMATDSFTLKCVTIGVSFHWRRQEDQTFRGSLQFIVERGMLTAINILSVEDYLASVISSEMSANASLELLKAHAVISRSWLLAQMQKPAPADGEGLDVMGDAAPVVKASTDSDEELIRWWERDDHVHFDVCADDHCQRYQGITRASTPEVQRAIEATWGQVLMYGGDLCDARFSKSCGGVFE